MKGDYNDLGMTYNHTNQGKTPKQEGDTIIFIKLIITASILTAVILMIN